MMVSAVVNTPPCTGCFCLSMSVNNIFKQKLPFYGPLNIKNPSKFLKESRKHFYEAFESSFPFNADLNNFQFLFVLAVGGFGTVVLAKAKSDKTLHAVKILKKGDLVKKNDIKEALNEKRILQGLDSPFCVRLEFFNQDNSYIYLFMPFLAGGDLYTILHKSRRFEESVSRFYASQVVLALEYLHYLDLIYRDLKPENLLIDHNGYLKLTDFGFTKIVPTRTYTLCGTPDYMAPEMIKGQGYGMTVDWWGLGVLLFEMNAGYPPFAAKEEMEGYEKILMGRYHLLPTFSADLKDLINQLLQQDLTRRLGNLQGGCEDVKKHKWFRVTHWLKLLNRKVTPPEKLRHMSSVSKEEFPRLKSFKKLKISEKDRYKGMFDEF